MEVKRLNLQKKARQDKRLPFCFTMYNQNKEKAEPDSIAHSKYRLSFNDTSTVQENLYRIPGKRYLPVSQAAAGRARTKNETLGQICLSHRAVLGSQTLV